MRESKVVDRMNVSAVGGARFMMVRAMSSFPTMIDLVAPNLKEEDLREVEVCGTAREDWRSMMRERLGGRVGFVSAGAM